jgi:hypothetical protein
LAFFGEAHSRIVISVSTERLQESLQIILASGLEHQVLGVVKGEAFHLQGVMNIPIEDLRMIWQDSLAQQGLSC